MHNSDIPLKLVLPMSKTVQYKLAYFLIKILKPLMCNDKECRDTFELIKYTLEKVIQILKFKKSIHTRTLKFLNSKGVKCLENKSLPIHSLKDY